MIHTTWRQSTKWYRATAVWMIHRWRNVSFQTSCRWTCTSLPTALNGILNLTHSRGRAIGRPGRERSTFWSTNCWSLIGGMISKQAESSSVLAAQMVKQSKMEHRKESWERVEMWKHSLTAYGTGDIQIEMKEMKELFDWKCGSGQSWSADLRESSSSTNTAVCFTDQHQTTMWCNRRKQLFQDLSLLPAGRFKNIPKMVQYVHQQRWFSFLVTCPCFCLYKKEKTSTQLPYFSDYKSHQSKNA